MLHLMVIMCIYAFNYCVLYLSLCVVSKRDSACLLVENGVQAIIALGIVGEIKFRQRPVFGYNGRN